MSMPFYVLKLGGSLMPIARDLMRALSPSRRMDYSFLVVPGGGPMADLVREIDSHVAISAGGRALDGNPCYGAICLFSGRWNGVRSPGRFAAQRAIQIIEILLPYQALQKDDLGLVHSWDYTSDSVAALVAHQL